MAVTVERPRKSMPPPPPAEDLDVIAVGVLRLHGRPQKYSRTIVHPICAYSDGSKAYRVNVYAEKDVGFMTQLFIAASYFIVRTPEGELITKK